MSQPRLAWLLPFLAALIVLAPTVADVRIYDDSRLAVSLTGWLSYLVHGLSTELLFRPLFLLSLLLEHTLSPSSALPSHVINVLLHAAVSVGLYALLRKNLGASFGVLIASLWFAVHPVHVDAVAFTKNRSETLAALFLLLAVWGILRPSVMLFASSFLLALLCKESSISTVSILALWTLWKERGLQIRQREAMRFLSFALLISAAYLIARVWALGRWGYPEDLLLSSERSLILRLADVSQMFFRYWTLLLVPNDLKVDYTDFHRTSSLGEGLFLLSIGFHLLLLSLAFIWRKKAFPVSIAIVAVYVWLLPVSHIVPIADWLAERFLYVPSLILAAAFAWGLDRALKSQAQPRFVKAAALLGIVSLSWMTFSYATYFRSDQTLWAEMVRRSPENAKFRYNLGLTLKEAGDFSGARHQLESAYRIDPAYGPLYLALGQAYLRLGLIREAGRLFEEGARRFPRDPAMQRNYALFHYDFGDLSVARKHLLLAIHLDPNDDDLKRRLALVEAKMARRRR